MCQAIIYPESMEIDDCTMEYIEEDMMDVDDMDDDMDVDEINSVDGTSIICPLSMRTLRMVPSYNPIIPCLRDFSLSKPIVPAIAQNFLPRVTSLNRPDLLINAPQA